MANKKKKQEEFISLSDLSYLCLYHWVWFAISFLVCMGGAAAYLLTTPKTYVQEVSVMIKDDNGGKSSNDDFGEEFKELGLELKTTNIKNEVREIKSKDVLLEVVRRLNLNIVYSTRISFKKLQPYVDELPFTLAYTPAENIKSASFDITIEQPELYVLSNFSNASDPISVKLDGDTVHTPIGIMAFEKSEYFESRTTVNQKIHVSVIPLEAAANNIKSRLKTDIPDQRVL